MTKSQQRHMRCLKLWLCAVCCLLCASVWCEGAQVEEINGLRIVRLSGSPREMGRQHGQLLRDEVRACTTQVLQYFRRYLKVPWVRSWLANWWLETVWRKASPFVPRAYDEELQGLSEGSGVPLRELKRLHAIPDRTYSCASFAAWGRATAEGRLIHMRNLDWNIDAGIQRFPVVFVVRPEGTHAFLNIGWAGFIGVLTGINEEGLSIGQIGAETADATFRGEPMVFLMRRVLEEADDIDAAAALITGAHRTVGVNYVIADATARRAMALETTRHHAMRFGANDAAERTIAYARPLDDAVVRADTAIDPTIREHQLASGGNPARPGVEAPRGSAYETRYLGQAAGLAAHFGTLDSLAAQAIAHAIAPDSNVQSVIFAWPDLWIANAEGLIPAASTVYHRLDAAALLQAPASGILRREPGHNSR